MSDDEKPDNLIQMKLKHYDSELDYKDKQIYNIQEDLRLILDVRLPQLNNSVASVNNNVTSLSEIIKLKTDRQNTKLEAIQASLNNSNWIGVIMIGMAIGYFILKLF